MKTLIVAMVGALMVGLSAPCVSYGGDRDTQCCSRSIRSKLCATDCMDNPWRGCIDTLFLGRDQTYADDLVMRSGSPSTVALSGTDLDFDSATGVRVGFHRSLSCCRELELLFTGMGDWDAEASVVGLNDLSLPGDLGLLADFSSTDAFQAKYSSGMRSFEANLTQAGYGADWLIGFRHMRIDETFKLTSFDLDTFQGEYGVETVNSLYGAQIGLRCEHQIEKTLFRVTAKTGIYSNAARQNSLVQTGNGVIISRNKMVTDDVLSNISEISLTSEFALSDCIGLRIGFDLLWASDLALAPNQLDFSDEFSSSDFVDTSGSIFMQGTHVGIVVDF